MIFLLLDFLISFFTLKPTYFFLLNILLISKNNWGKLLIITLILDLLILNTYFINTVIIFIIFCLYKKMAITKLTFFNYILSLTLIYFLYILSIGLFNHYSVPFLVMYAVKSYLVTFIFFTISYKLVYKFIKLSR